MTTKQNVAAALAELEQLYKTRDKYLAQEHKALEPHREQYEANVSEIRERFDSKLTPTMSRIDALEKEVSVQMLTNVNADGRPKLNKVASENLQAEVVQSAARREVDAEAFFDFVPALQRRGAAFWNCFAVQIGKAEKFLGERINDIAVVKQNFKVVIRPK